MESSMELMMKCDMCYDRTSVGKKPMCATVCPSGALHYGPMSEIEAARPLSQPMNEFRFGGQTIRTKVLMMVPRQSPVTHLDVMDGMFESDPSPEDDAMLAGALFELPIV